MDEPAAARGVKESRKVLELIFGVREKGMPIVLIKQCLYRHGRIVAGSKTGTLLGTF